MRRDGRASQALPGRRGRRGWPPPAQPQLANDPAQLVPILGVLPPGTPVAVEVACGWGWLVELLLPEEAKRLRRRPASGRRLPHRPGSTAAASDQAGAPRRPRGRRGAERRLASQARQDKLRGRRLRVDTTVVDADINYPTDADLLEHALRKLGGAGPPSQGPRRGQPDPVPGSSAAHRRARPHRPHHAARGPGGGAQRPADTGRSTRGWALGRLVGELTETIVPTQRLLAQTDQRLGGNRVIPDRLVSLADPGAQPIREGKPRSPTRSATRCWWPRTSVASSATIGSSRQHSGRAAAGPGGRARHGGHQPAARHRGRRPRLRHRRQQPGAGRLWALSGSGDSAPARQARLGWHWSGLGPSTGCGLPGRDRGQDQPPQAQLWGCGALGCGGWVVPQPGGAGDLRLQPAAQDGGRRMPQARRRPPISMVARHAHQVFFMASSTTGANGPAECRFASASPLCLDMHPPRRSRKELPLVTDLPVPQIGAPDVGSRSPVGGWLASSRCGGPRRRQRVRLRLVLSAH